MRKEAIDVRNDADSMVFQTEKALTEVGDKIDASEKTTVEDDLTRLKELIEKSNPEVMSEGEVADIKAAKEKLMTDAQALFAKLYEQSGAAGADGPGPDMSGGAGQSGSAGGYDGDVVDGDYREV
jgi:molecular chaperone DnaK